MKSKDKMRFITAAGSEIGKAIAIAQVTLWLAAECSSFITRIAIVADGSTLAQKE